MVTEAHGRKYKSQGEVRELLTRVRASSDSSSPLMSSGRRPGDWNCGSCRHHNFSWRDSCQQCGAVKSTDGAAAVDGGSNFLPGDWYCLCGGHNFANRSSCHFCGAPSNGSVVNIYDVVHGSGGAEHGPGSGWKPGDWLCTRSGCNQHNFASRKLCYRCKAPKGMQETTTTTTTAV